MSSEKLLQGTFKEQHNKENNRKMSYYKPSQPQPLSMGANDAESSDDSDEEMNFAECYDLWFEGKTQSTVASYRRRADDFIKWYADEYGRAPDNRLKAKHLKRFFVLKAKSCGQLRACVVCIKSLCRFLYKKKILRRDITLNIDDPKQLPPTSERTMTPATVKAFFAIANQKKDPSTVCMLQVLTYAGLRITALSRLHAADIKCDEHAGLGGVITKSYKIHVRNGKGGKDRYCPLNKKVGEHLYQYAQSLNTTYLFPGKKAGKPLHSQSISGRIKRMAKAVGKPEISAHFFRHFMASNALHNVSERVSFNAALFLLTILNFLGRQFKRHFGHAWGKFCDFFVFAVQLIRCFLWTNNRPFSLVKISSTVASPRHRFTGRH